LWKIKLVKWLPVLFAVAVIAAAPYIKTIWGDVPNATL